MADAKRDSNRVPTLLAVSDADGLTPVAIYADPTTHELLVQQTGGGGGGDVNITQVGGVAFSLGQALAAASLPVVLASDQTLPLPTGAATAARQDTGNTSLATLAGAVSGTEVQVDVLTMPTTTVQATNLDIRDLAAASDSVSVHGDVGILDQLDLTFANPATVAVVDSNGNQVSSFGGTQYTDAALDLTPTGTVAMGTDGTSVFALRTNDNGFLYTLLTGDGLTSLQLIDDAIATTASAITTKGMAAAGTDGTNARILKTDTNGELQVDVLTLPAVTNAGTFAVQVDGAALTSLQLLDDGIATTGSAITTKGMAAVGTDGTNARILKTDTSGELQVDVLTLPTLSTVTTVGTVTNITNQGQIADDAAFTPATTRVMMAGFFFDDVSPDTVNEGDGGAARMSSNRNQYVQIRDNAGNERGLNIDANGELGVSAIRSALPSGTNIIGRVGSDITGIAHGVTTVTTAGTDVVLAASTTCKRVTIQAQTDNTGVIAVGGSGVDATVATGTGVLLFPGDVFELEIDNLNDVYIDSTVNGEGVRYTYFT